MNELTKELKVKTGWVIFVTAIAMVLEIVYGFITHSMALTGDGIHMGAHILILTITYIIFSCEMKFKEKAERLNALGGYTSALFLGLTSLWLVYESVMRIFEPETIAFKEAILVLLFGLLINLICIFIMRGKHDYLCKMHHHHETHHCEENLNYKAAYVHIVADLLTAILAVFALLAGKFFGLWILDPIVGILSAIIILHWAYVLIKSAIKMLV